MDALPFYRTRNTVQKPSGAKYPANPKTLGEHIRKIRIDRDLTQREVATLLGVTNNCLTIWEKGHSNPQIQYYPKIIEFLGYYPFLHRALTIVEMLKHIRFNYGIDYKTCAKMFGISVRSYSKWEKGKAMPHPKHRNKIEKIWQKLPYQN